jgi:hypothetical protein
VGFNDYSEYTRGLYHKAGLTTVQAVSATPIKVGRVVIACGAANAKVTFEDQDGNDKMIFRVLANDTKVFNLGHMFSSLSVVSDQSVDVSITSFVATSVVDA